MLAITRYSKCVSESSFRWDTYWMALATAQMPSYVYPWKREYSLPRRLLYSARYSSAVCGVG